MMEHILVRFHARQHPYEPLPVRLLRRLRRKHPGTDRYIAHDWLTYIKCRRVGHAIAGTPGDLYCERCWERMLSHDPRQP